MNGVNKAIIVGTFGKAPEARYLPNGDAVVNFSLATNEKWTDKATGERKEKTEWHRCVAFGKAAEVINEYMEKGSHIYVEGKLQTRKWTDKDGVEKYSTEIVVERFTFLGGRGSSDDGEAREPARGSGKGGANGAKPGPKGPAGTKFDDFEDDIPF